ncbi:hypothetical protein CAPTEDRAFT_197346 [Capitella teleta]|uniref:Uncharacterized protein n=1 Tax=Capitella teleta TaxID=283909 RepID=R7TXG7_CAPTE|nr:hypothetical protein CAPTEDRAFT_197346 [Capitella teleta]|eukprot:ELT95670.1 hypothetical protein CAPTEDRAFT_197346 [Capitella teleta]
MAPGKLDANLIKSLLDEQSDMLKAEIKSIRDEVMSLKAELTALKSEASPQLQNSASPPSTRTLEDTVTASVKTALRDEKTKCKVVLSQLSENKRLTKDVEEMCQRTCRSRKDQAQYVAPRAQVRSLNDAALENGVNESFNIRKNGEVWGFTKSENGKWRRDVNWKLASTLSHEDQSPSDSPSGNGSTTPSQG